MTYLGVGNGMFNPTGSPIRAADGFLIAPPFVMATSTMMATWTSVTRTTLSGPDETLFLWGDGKGSFTSQAIVSDQWFTLQVGDVNGDGIPDIFGGATYGFAYPSVVLGQNGRNFPSAQVLFLTRRVNSQAEMCLAVATLICW